MTHSCSALSLKQYPQRLGTDTDGDDGVALDTSIFPSLLDLSVVVDAEDMGGVGNFASPPIDVITCGGRSKPDCLTCSHLQSQFQLYHSLSLLSSLVSQQDTASQQEQEGRRHIKRSHEKKKQVERSHEKNLFMCGRKKKTKREFIRSVIAKI